MWVTDPLSGLWERLPKGSMLFLPNSDHNHLLCVQFQATVEEGAVGVIVNLTVEDKDDPATGAWRAAYTIINGNPGQSFEIHTNPQTNEGMLSVVKVRTLPLLLPPHQTEGLPAGEGQGEASPSLLLLGLKKKKAQGFRVYLYPHGPKTTLFHRF